MLQEPGWLMLTSKGVVSLNIIFFLKKKSTERNINQLAHKQKEDMCIYDPFSNLKEGERPRYNCSSFVEQWTDVPTDEMAEELLWSLGVGKHLPAYLQESRHRSQPLGEGRGRGAWWNMESFCKVPQLGNYTISFRVEELSEIVLYWKGLSMWLCDLYQNTRLLLNQHLEFLFPRARPGNFESRCSGTDDSGVTAQAIHAATERWCTTFGWSLIYAGFT